MNLNFVNHNYLGIRKNVVFDNNLFPRLTHPHITKPHSRRMCLKIVTNMLKEKGMKLFQSILFFLSNSLDFCITWMKYWIKFDNFPVFSISHLLNYFTLKHRMLSLCPKSTLFSIILSELLFQFQSLFLV